MCDGPLESYVLGTHEWRVEGDNVQCSTKGEAYTATLKLTGCREGEFTCYDGQCIRTVARENIFFQNFCMSIFVFPSQNHRNVFISCMCSMEERCDQITHCRDESDEDNCKLIVFKDNYNNKVPPFTVNPEDGSMVPVKVKVSTSLMNVLAISEFSHIIDLKLGITLKWYENRVFYHNLKTEEALNVLSDREVRTCQN